MKKYEYKIEVLKEGALSSMLLGSSKLPIKKMEEVINAYGAEGWQVSVQLVETHRLFLLWTREAAVITFVREV